MSDEPVAVDVEGEEDGSGSSEEETDDEVLISFWKAAWLALVEQRYFVLDSLVHGCFRVPLPREANDHSFGRARCNTAHVEFPCVISSLHMLLTYALVPPPFSIARSLGIGVQGFFLRNLHPQSGISDGAWQPLAVDIRYSDRHYSKVIGSPNVATTKPKPKAEVEIQRKFGLSDDGQDEHCRCPGSSAQAIMLSLTIPSQAR
jgi:hypothetical protein